MSLFDSACVDCLPSAPWLGWAMALADGLLALACFAVAPAVSGFARRAGVVVPSRLAWPFSALVVACGVLLVVDIGLIVWGGAVLHVLMQGMIACTAIVAASMVWPVLRRALQDAVTQTLKAASQALEAQGRRCDEAQLQLAETEQGLSATLSSLDTGLIGADAQARVRRMNGAAQRLTGWSLDDAWGRGVWDVVARDDRPPAAVPANAVDVMLDLGALVDSAHHMTIRVRGGLRRDLEVGAALTRTAEGTVNGLLMLFRDISAPLRSQDDAQRLAAIVDSSYDAIIGKTLDGRITNWNHAAETLLGYSADEAIGQPVAMLIPPERADEEARILADLAHGERVTAFDTERLAKGGRRLQVSITVSPIRDAQGRFVGASKIMRDVSQQRRAEADLRDSEARLRFTVESAEIGDWDLDLSSGLIRHSLLFDRCFGYDTAQAGWHIDNLMAHVHPDDRTGAERSLRKAIADWRDWHLDCRVTWPDASVHCISVHGNAPHRLGKISLADPTGEPFVPTHMRGIISDTTSQRLAEGARLTAQRLESENRQVREASHLKSQFLAGMSHELRTPLNAIIGFSELLASGRVPLDDPRGQTYLNHISTSGHHLLDLINDLLDLSRIETGKLEFFPEPVDLAQIMAEVTGTLGPAMERMRIQLHTEIDASLTDIVLDPLRLRQVLYNYLSNAIKFSHEAGAITVRARADGAAHFRLEVEDEGIGMADADVGRLFTDFNQFGSDRVLRNQGAGLGLALTRRLVQAQGGRVGVRSVLGRGSVFHAVLDRRRSTDAAPPAVAEPRGAAGVERRLLVIEDNPVLRAELADELSRAGFHVDFATSGADALARARAASYDALTLDLLLPDRSGLGLLGHIRRDGPNQDSPVIGLSVPVPTGEVATFAISNLLSKPIRTEQVATALAALSLRRPVPATVLVIDDELAALDLMRATLQGLGIEAVCRRDARLALQEIDRTRPDAILIDLVMPGFDGFAVLDALRQLSNWRDTPVYLMTSLILAEAEIAELTHSAGAIFSAGGGAVTDLIDSLRRWRPASAELVGRSVV